MEEINAIPGKRYYLSMYRQSFGNYWMEIEVVKVVPKQTKYYSILYKKFNDPYPFTGGQNPVWCHHETARSWNLRIMEV